MRQTGRDPIERRTLARELSETRAGGTRPAGLEGADRYVEKGISGPDLREAVRATMVDAPR